MNIFQDIDGDTPMHDSITTKDGQPNIVQIVLNAKGTDYKMENKMGFPVICWAALKDNREYVNFSLFSNLYMAYTQGPI